jgi:prepilin-type N-terminal cleavage/methylation domain-containing protein
MMRWHGAPRAQRGLTLIELLTSLTLVGILTTIAAPSLHALVQQRRLDGAVQAYLSQLHWARLQAVAMNRPVYIGFGETPTGSCYVFYVGERDRCGCGLADSDCSDGASLLLSTELPQANGVSVSSTTKGITLDELRGTVTPTFTATFTARNGLVVKASTSIMGRTRACGPSPGTPGWPACA